MIAIWAFGSWIAFFVILQLVLRNHKMFQQVNINIWTSQLTKIIICNVQQKEMGIPRNIFQHNLFQLYTIYNHKL